MTMKLSYLLLGTAVSLALGAQDANAAKRQVGTCTTNPLQYTTIQSAVNAANTGDMVQVCPGTYPEEVAIAKAITLTNVPGQTPLPTITIPGGGAVQNTTTLSGHPTAAQIVVTTPSPPTGKVNVRNIIVDGSNNNIQTCGLQFIGIYYQNAGGAITGNTAENQILPSGFQGCQSGLGILTEALTAGTPAVAITNNTVKNFDKNGITVDDSAEVANISGNIVTGVGPTAVIAQNGIQLAYGATGKIANNSITGLFYNGSGADDGGILIYDTSPAVKISGNILSSAQVGIWLDATGGTSGSFIPVGTNQVSSADFGIVLQSDFGYDENAQISADYISVGKNTVSGSTYDDIDVCSDNNKISVNSVSTASQSGIHLDGECTEADNSSSGINNRVAGNTIDNNCVGILSGPAVGANNIRGNTFSGNTNNYIYGQDSYSCSAHRKGAKKVVPLVQPLAH